MARARRIWWRPTAAAVPSLSLSLEATSSSDGAPSLPPPTVPLPFLLRRHPFPSSSDGFSLPKSKEPRRRPHPPPPRRAATPPRLQQGGSSGGRGWWRKQGEFGGGRWQRPSPLSLEARRRDGGLPQQWPGAEGGSRRGGERRSGGARGLLRWWWYAQWQIQAQLGLDTGFFIFFFILLTVAGIKPPR